MGQTHIHVEFLLLLAIALFGLKTAKLSSLLDLNILVRCAILGSYTKFNKNTSTLLKMSC